MCKKDAIARNWKTGNAGKKRSPDDRQGFNQCSGLRKATSTESYSETGFEAESGSTQFRRRQMCGNI